MNTLAGMPIQIHLMLLLIMCAHRRHNLLHNSNTSHVTINQYQISPGLHGGIIQIHLMLLLIALEILMR